MMKTSSVLRLLVVMIFLFISFLMISPYLSYGKALENKQHSIEVTEKSDLENLRDQDTTTLEQFGFNKKEIKVLHELASEDLALNNFIGILGDYEGDLVRSEINQLEESNDRKDIVEISTEPVETVYLDGEKRIYFTKLYYTVEVKSPMLFQSQDQFKLDSNEWTQLFRYAKLHYVAKNGETYEEYMGGDQLIGFRNTPLTFEVRKKVNDESFYLAGISGVILMEGSGSLSLYAEYISNQLIRNISKGQAHSDWQWVSQ